MKQAPDESRNLDETLGRAWEVLSTLPESELTKIKEKHIKAYYKGK